MPFDHRWFDEGVAQGHAYMAVWCDTYDWSDLPKYYASAAECQEDIDKTGGNMQKVIEVYDLNQPKQPQVKQYRCWALRPRNN